MNKKPGHKLTDKEFEDLHMQAASGGMSFLWSFHKDQTKRLDEHPEFLRAADNENLMRMNMLHHPDEHHLLSERLRGNPNLFWLAFERRPMTLAKVSREQAEAMGLTEKIYIEAVTKNSNLYPNLPEHFRAQPALAWAEVKNHGINIRKWPESLKQNLSFLRQARDSWLARAGKYLKVKSDSVLEMDELIAKAERKTLSGQAVKESRTSASARKI